MPAFRQDRKHGQDKKAGRMPALQLSKIRRGGQDSRGSLDKSE
jgi:hypothetical protein